jgi:hypothetical protein
MSRLAVLWLLVPGDRKNAGIGATVARKLGITDPVRRAYDDTSTADRAPRGNRLAGPRTPATESQRVAPIRETLTVIRSLPIRFPSGDFLIVQGVCGSDVTSGQTLRFGKLRPLGKLENLPEAEADLRTK